MAGGAIQSFLSDVAGGFFGNDYLRDYSHASKTFRSNFYQNAPKFKFLFHVYFDINAAALVDKTQIANENFGLLVKTVKLPGFNFATHEMNQYNRKRLVQTKIKYDPIDILFHDDNENLINSLWYNYYTYYYQDATKPKVIFAGDRGGASATQPAGGGANASPSGANYNARTTYQPSISGNEDWGFIGETNTPSGADPVKLPFFKNITVFGFNRHNFMAYTLVNPIITRFNHDSYNYSEGGGTMENSMTLDYETVLYNQGQLDGNAPNNIVTGFGDQATYDRKLSPIATPGSNSNILGPNGLLAAAGGAITTMTNGNVLDAVRIAGTAYNSAKNINLSVSLQAEVSQAIQNALQGTNNTTRQKMFDIPVYGQTPSTSGIAGAPTANVAPPTLFSGAIDTVTQYAGSQIGGALQSVTTSLFSK